MRPLVVFLVALGLVVVPRARVSAAGELRIVTATATTELAPRRPDAKPVAQRAAAVDQIVLGTPAPLIAPPRLQLPGAPGAPALPLVTFETTCSARGPPG